MPTSQPATHASCTPAKPVIGLMGAPGSGKSTVAKFFAELRCAVIDADRLAHAALQTDAVKTQVRQRWGDAVFAADASINRAALGKIVFADPMQLKELEAMLHPLVHQARQSARQRHQVDPDVVAIVEDCPLLLESKLDTQCDAIVFVDTPHALRLDRVLATRGWDAEELKKRDQRQLPLDTKRQAADYVLRNERDLAYLRNQVRNVLKTITDQAPA